MPASPSPLSGPVTPATASIAYFQSTPGTSPQSSCQSPINFGFTTAPIALLSHSSPLLGEGQSACHTAQSTSNKLHAILEGSQSRAVTENATPPSSEALKHIYHYQSADPFTELRLKKPIAYGQWSTVYTAICDAYQGMVSTQHQSSKSVLRSSETIPVDPSYCSARQCRNSAQLFAAKVGIGKTAGEVLLNESRILTFLMHRPLCKEFVVQFDGYDIQHKALVMEYIPLTLENLVMELNEEQDSERNERVKRELLPISRHLVGGLHFLHRETVIHGDIKPANILLRARRVHRDSEIAGLEDPSASLQGQRHGYGSGEARSQEKFQLQPVYCDFSASRLNRPDSIPSDSAGTYDYMAPELFSVSKPDNYPSFASDVYALGVTLIYAVIGRSAYEGASNVFMRRAMAMKGSPLDFVAADPQSFSRMEEAGFQFRVEKAVQTKPQNRWTAASWMRSIDSESDV